MTRYVGAIDQGTTSTRFIVFDHGGTIITSAQKEHQQIYPKPGWVEHDPMEIWLNTQEVIGGALARAGSVPRDLAAVGITNQRETTVVWDHRSGEPLHNALVWQDTRVDQSWPNTSKNGGPNRFRAKTGLPMASYFSRSKVQWIWITCPAPVAGRSPATAVRQHRHVVVVESHRRIRRRAALYGCHECEPHPTDESRTLAMGRRIARVFKIPAWFCRASLLQRIVRRGQSTRAFRRVQSRASSAISRRRWSARPVSAPARQKTPTARGVFF